MKRDTLRRGHGGQSLRFGDPALLLELVEETGKRQGFGDVLAEGSFRLAERLGKESANLLHCFKKVEVAGHSARALKGMSIGYATATRGGSHHDARPTLQYAGEFDRTKAQGQPSFAVRTQNFTAMDDSLTQCRFASERGYGGLINENYVKMINSVTGWDFTLAELEESGERIYNLERAFNCREGVSRKDDALPYRTIQPADSRRAFPGDVHSPGRIRRDAGGILPPAGLGFQRDSHGGETDGPGPGGGGQRNCGLQIADCGVQRPQENGENHNLIWNKANKVLVDDGGKSPLIRNPKSAIRN